mmetsp:Transcript_5209/g.6022  ORF Transcript_5209/g.6022 Transcript_5209/m.6022 type:complete len:133 (+) Transcript_5209:131-529(+)
MLLQQAWSRESLLSQATLLSYVDETFEDATRRRRQEQLRKFLEKHGFSAVDRPREGPDGGRVRLEPLFAIHLAAQIGDSRAVKLLLAEGADPDATFKGSNALEIAMAEDQNGSHNEVIAILHDALQVRTLKI